MSAELQAAQAALREDQQYLQEKFWRYRNGDDTYSKSKSQIQFEFNLGRRHHWRSIQARQVPRVDYRRQSRETKRILNAPLADLNRVFHTRPDGNQVAFNILWHKRGTATQEFQRATAIMTARKSFTFVKILGAGGNGIVVLWRWTPGGDPQADGYDVVMKFSIGLDANGSVDWDDIDDEFNVMMVSGGTPKSTLLAIAGLRCLPSMLGHGSGAAHNTNLFLR